MRYIRGLLCHTIIYSCGSCNVILQEPSQIRTTLLRNSLKPIFGCFSRKRLQLLIFGFSWALLYVFCLKFQAACNAAIYKVLSLLEKKCPFFACARPCFSRPNSQIWLFGRERVKWRWQCESACPRASWWGVSVVSVNLLCVRCDV